MKTKYFILSLIITLASCKKDNETTNNTGTPPNTIDNYFAAHLQSDQQFTLNASLGGTIIGSKGTELTFGANSFITSTGQQVTGNVIIFLKEFISKADLIFNNIYTASNGRPLMSGGAYEIHVKQNGNELSIAQNKTYSVKMTASPDNDQMYVYKGSNNTSGEFGKVDWSLNQSSLNSFTTTVFDSSFFSQIGTINDLNYINCDHPYDSLYSELNVSFTGTDFDRFIPIVIAKNTRTVVGNISVSGNSFQWKYAPPGIQLRIFMIATKNDKLFLTQQLVTFNGQAVTLPVFLEISSENLTSFINSL